MRPLTKTLGMFGSETDEEFNESAPLSYEISRCRGSYKPVPFGSELYKECIACLRRKVTGNPLRQSYIISGDTKGACQYFIKESK